MAEDDPFEGLLVGDLKSWAKGKTIEDLAAIEFEDEAMFPETIARWDLKAKQLRECPVYVRRPRDELLNAARVAALKSLAKTAGRDPLTFDPDLAIRLYGAGRWEQHERLHILSTLLRRRDDPARQYMLPEFLDKCHPAEALRELDEKIAAADKLLDRRLRIEDIPNAEPVFWALVSQIARRSNLSPLVVIAGQDQTPFVVFMAEKLEEFRQRLSSLESPSTSSSAKTEAG